MDEQDLQRKIDMLAKKRDHAADVLNKPLLAWSYQDEIDRLIAAHDRSEGQQNG